VSHEMEVEDYLAHCRAECAALKEQVDNMVALLCQKDRRIADLEDLQAKTVERLNRTTMALDEALGMVRRNRAERQADMEAYEL
jgi:hypothetical protein